MTNLPPCTLLDYETKLYKGCGASELISITIITSCFWMPLALIIGAIALNGIHALFISFAVFIAGTLLFVAATAQTYKTIKQDKPEGWHIRQFCCSVHPLLSPDLIYKSGYWSTIREI